MTSISSIKTPDNYTQAIKYMMDVTQDLSHCRDIGMVMEIVRTAARKLTGADGATFILRDGEKCYYADEDAISPLWKGHSFPMELCVSGWVIKNAHPVIIPDIYMDARIPIDAYRRTFVKSMAMVPIRKENCLGAIGNYWAYGHYATIEELSLLETLANMTSIAIENINLQANIQKHDAPAFTKKARATSDMVYGADILENLNRHLNIPPGFRIITKSNFNNLSMPRMPIQQIFFNLVRNAIEHHHLESGTITIDVEETDSHFMFGVVDDGPGISLSRRQTIHEIFRSNTKHDLSQGPNLGLKIIKKILDAYNGEIHLSAHSGRGSTFMFTWPKT